jgi:uncharacterized membrane protein YhdT
LTGSRFNEKAILLLIIAFLIVFIVAALRLITAEGAGQRPSFFRLMTVIMLALLAVSVYRFIKS